MSYQFRHWTIQDHMLDSLRQYVEHGVPVGHFLTAVLSNDLFDACNRADDYNIENIPAYVAYLYNNCNSQCYGTPQKVRAWLAKHEAERVAAEARKPEETA